MATSPQTGSITFAEFERLPLPADRRFELRHGEVVEGPPAKYAHFLIQQAARDLLDQAAGESGRAYTEAGFKPVPDHEFFVVDVAHASVDWWARNMKLDYLPGAPALVVEVLSPSNTAEEMLDKEQLCLENGSQEFWLVDSKHRQVKVSSADGRSRIFHLGQEIPLFFATAKTLSVDAISAPLED